MKKIALIFMIFLTVQVAFSLEIGDPAPTFANPGLDGRFVFSKNYYGGKWVLLDFFATWCENCKEELPLIEKLGEEIGKDQLAIILMDVDKEGPSIVKPYFESNPTTLTVVIDRYMVVAKKFGVIDSETGAGSLPALFLVNPQGKIVFIEFGKSDTIGEELKAIILNTEG